MLTPKKDQPLDLSVAPSQSPDRQEVLILFMGKSREGHIHKSLPIVRAERGRKVRRVLRLLHYSKLFGD